LKLCIPEHSCLITFFLAGARCNPVPTKQQLEEGKEVPAFAVEARDFTRSLIHHQDVSVTIDGQDNSGAFRGNLYFKKKTNLATLLLSKGYAFFTSIGRSADAKATEKEYEKYEEEAKAQRLGIWKDYDPEAEAEMIRKQEAELEALAKPRKEIITITEVVDGSHFFYHVIDKEQEQLEKLMANLAASDLDSQPAHTPQRDEAVAVKFSGDGQWYRGLVSGLSNNGVKIWYGDYGNTETAEPSRIRKLKPEFGTNALKWQAREGHLAYIQTKPPSTEWGREAGYFFRELVWGKTLLATVEYEDGHKNFLNLLPTDDPDTFVNGELVKAGLAKVPRRLPRRANQELVDWLRNQQAEAFNNRRGVWEYGDDGEEDEYEDKLEYGRSGRPAKPAGGK